MLLQTDYIFTLQPTTQPQIGGRLEYLRPVVEVNPVELGLPYNYGVINLQKVSEIQGKRAIVLAINPGGTLQFTPTTLTPTMSQCTGGVGLGAIESIENTHPVYRGIQNFILGDGVGVKPGIGGLLVGENLLTTDEMLGSLFWVMLHEMYKLGMGAIKARGFSINLNAEKRLSGGIHLHLEVKEDGSRFSEFTSLGRINGHIKGDTYTASTLLNTHHNHTQNLIQYLAHSGMMRKDYADALNEFRGVFGKVPLGNTNNQRVTRSLATFLTNTYHIQNTGGNYMQSANTTNGRTPLGSKRAVRLGNNVAMLPGYTQHGGKLSAAIIANEILEG